MRYTKRQLFYYAYLEYRITKQYSQSISMSYIEFDGKIPSGFKRQELGYDGTGGPNIEKTMQGLELINERNADILQVRGEQLSAKERKRYYKNKKRKRTDKNILELKRILLECYDDMI